MIGTEAGQLVATIAVVSGAPAGAACLLRLRLRLRDRDGGYAPLNRQLFAVTTSAGRVALVADHRAVRHLAPRA